MNVTQADVISTLVCPSCKSKLTKKGCVFSCSLCSNMFGATEGVLSFTDKFRKKEAYVENWITELKNGKQVLSKHIYSHGVKRGELISNFIKKHVNLRGSKVLDIGCNMGGISIAFSKQCEQVFSVDVALSKLRLFKLRLSKDKIRNVRVFHANAKELPFQSNIFDLAIINGVLEWSAVGNDGNPKDIHLQVLKEANRTLKPGGALYLAIENRYWILYFLGIKDHHSKLRFAPVLPRKLANVISTISGLGEYRHYLYSYQELNDMVKAAGFKKIRFYTAIRNYPYPEYIIDINDNQSKITAINKVMRNGGLYESAMKIGSKIMKYIDSPGIFSQNFVVLAVK